MKRFSLILKIIALIALVLIAAFSCIGFTKGDYIFSSIIILFVSIIGFFIIKSMPKIKHVKKIEEKTKVKDKKKYGFVIFFIIIVLGFITLIGTCTRSCINSIGERSGIDSIEFEIKASRYAKEFIKLNLKSPSTAEFSDVRVWLCADSTVVVKGNVDSQNSFGAMLRSGFYVKMKWYNDYREKENWQLIKVNFE